MFNNLNLELKNEFDQNDVSIKMNRDGVIFLRFGTNSLTMDIEFANELIDALTIVANARLRMGLGEE